MRPRHLVLFLCLLSVPVLVAPVVFVAVMTAARPTAVSPSPTRAGVATAMLPPLAKQMLPFVATVIDERCPELSVLRVLAEVAAESGWRPEAWSEDINGGAAGLLQMNETNWISLGGQVWGGAPPPPQADIYDPSVHLTLGINFLCGNLRAMAVHLRQAGKAIDPMDAMSVCHIAGCSRVVNSRSGIPEAGEAGCDQRCASLIRRYLGNIHDYERRWTATPADAGPPGAVPAGIDVGVLPGAASFTGGPRGCTSPDPTSAAGCVTAATAHAYQELKKAFGPQIRSAGCWAQRPWNPTSDHPSGRACDVFPDRAGIFPRGEPLTAGWRMAAWLRANAEALLVKYVIWQGRYWDPTTGDQGGWGERYTGGGVYNTSDPTGGHYDHIHVSFTE
ncbi:hypothetical protein ABZ215_41405 [Amycolatopsis sp. NPDC006131]|uniref:hypothetical protein n=1 Tax=Amycolatopsis sp. NPDC006131 TaxID=3156731 RepID=UPI0033B2A1E8